MNELTPAFMKNYFRDAAELEKRKYVFEGAIRETNGKLTKVKKEHEKIKTTKADLENSLYNIEQKYIDEETAFEQKVESNKKTKQKFGKLKKLATIAVIIGGILLVLSWLISFGFGDGESSPFFILVVFMVYLEAGAVALLIISKVKTNRATDFLEKATTRNLSQEKEDERNRLRADISTCDQRIAELNTAENSLNSIYSDLNKHYTAVKNALSALYGKNLISPHYHNFSAMATFHHYLATGRCVEIIGPGGVIDTYEKDLQFKIAYSALNDIREIAIDNNVLMAEIKNEANITNQKLTAINHALGSIESSTASVASSNQAIANYCAESNQTLQAIYARY